MPRTWWACTEGQNSPRDRETYLLHSLQHGLQPLCVHFAVAVQKSEDGSCRHVCPTNSGADQPWSGRDMVVLGGTQPVCSAVPSKAQALCPLGLSFPLSYCDLTSLRICWFLPSFFLSLIHPSINLWMPSPLHVEARHWALGTHRWTVKSLVNRWQ